MDLSGCCNAAAAGCGYKAASRSAALQESEDNEMDDAERAAGRGSTKSTSVLTAELNSTAADRPLSYKQSQHAGKANKQKMSAGWQLWLHCLQLCIRSCLSAAGSAAVGVTAELQSSDNRSGDELCRMILG
jgi:hypothetical protein